MTTVGLPGGGTATFPDSMTPDQITAALKKQFPQPAQAQPVDAIERGLRAILPESGPAATALKYLLPQKNIFGGESTLAASARIDRERLAEQARTGRMPMRLDNPMLGAFGPANIMPRGVPSPVPPTGAVMPPVAGPRIAPPQATLAARGVQMTPGQAVGGFAKSAEDIAQSFPILGHFIQNARTRSLKSFNEATINQALEPIGRRVPKTIEPGTDTIRWASSRAGRAFDDVLDRIPAVAFDPELKVALNTIATEARKNPAVWSQFEPILMENVRKPFSTAGRLEGAEIQKIGSDLARRARGYKRSDEFDKRELGHLFDDMRMALSDAIERQYPAEAPALQAARKSWAMLTRIEQAAGRRVGSEGIFTPADLLTASRSQAGGIRRGGVPAEFAHGDALFQKWGTYAQRVLPSKIPDSGTAGRLLAADIAGGLAGVGGMMASPMATLGSLAGLVGGSIPYIPAASRGIQNFMTSAASGRLSQTGIAAGRAAATKQTDYPDAPRPSVAGP